ncbi:MAG: hypothetical protein VX672_02325 [Planctomycetota bacterium]|nr:hypothetical protein [Planctomycetota bacterium]
MNPVSPFPKAFLLVVLAVLVLVVPLGCGPVKGYSGPARADAEVALIEPNPIWSDIGVVVQGVDGMDVNAEMAITVLPGDRTLRLMLRPYSRAEFQEVSGPQAEMQNSYDLRWRTPIEWDLHFEAGGRYAFAGRWEEEVYLVEFQALESRKILATRNVPAIRNDP